MNDTHDFKLLGTQVIDDITLLAKDMGSLIAEACERVYSFVVSALKKRKAAKSASD